jgi:hypothetical protein
MEVCGQFHALAALSQGKLGKKLGVQWTVHQLFMNYKKAYESVRREVLYIIHMKLVR